MSFVIEEINEYENIGNDIRNIIPMIENDVLKINYKESFSLENNKNVSDNETYFILDKIEFQHKFIIEDNFYIFKGKNNKILINIQLFYEWLDSDISNRFIISFFKNDELVFNKYVGINDFKNIKGLYTEKIPINISENDKFFFKLLKMNDKILKFRNNSSLQIEYLL